MRAFTHSAEGLVLFARLVDRREQALSLGRVFFNDLLGERLIGFTNLLRHRVGKDVKFSRLQPGDQRLSDDRRWFADVVEPSGITHIGINWSGMDAVY